MSYIGNVPTTAAFPFDQFSGTGVQVAFTLSQAPASTTSIAVTVSGVVQNPNTYSVSGTTLTFTEAPPTGTNNIGVLFLGLPAIVGIPSDGVVTPAMLSTGGPEWDAGGVLSFNSGYGSNAPAYGCRAWVNFNGTGTVAIRASGNVSSITDHAGGDYTVNFATAMPDVNYATNATCNQGFGGGTSSAFACINSSRTYAAGSVPIIVKDADEVGGEDRNLICVSVFR